MQAFSLCSLLLIGVAPVVDAAFGQSKPVEHFDKDISKHFISTTKRSYVLRKAAKVDKPVVVLITRPGCGACQNLKQSLNMGSSVKALLDKELVLVVHVEGRGMEEPGKFLRTADTPLPIHGTSEGSPHFFHDESTLAWGK
eukprot:gene8951-16321_t